VLHTQHSSCFWRSRHIVLVPIFSQSWILVLLLLEHLVARSELQKEQQSLRISCYINFINYIPTKQQPELHTQYSDLAKGSKIRASISGCGQRCFSSPKHPDQSASYSVGTRCSFFGDKAANVCEVNQSLPSTAMVKNEWSYQYTSIPPMHLHGVNRSNFIFTPWPWWLLCNLLKHQGLWLIITKLRS